jgi:hypothetical protein
MVSSSGFTIISWDASITFSDNLSVTIPNSQNGIEISAQFAAYCNSSIVQTKINNSQKTITTSVKSPLREKPSRGIEKRLLARSGFVTTIFPENLLAGFLSEISEFITGVC